MIDTSFDFSPDASGEDSGSYSPRLPRYQRSRALLVGALLGTIWSQRVDAQRIAPTARDNAAYIELAGAGGLYSLNVERRLSPTLLGRFGGTYYDITNMDQTRRAVSAVIAGGTYLIDVSTLLRRGPGRFLELGGVAVAGSFTHASYGSTKASGPFSAAVPFAGLRYELPGGGLLLRVTAQQVLPLSGNKRTDAGKAAWAGTWSGFSFGYAF